MGSMNNNDEHNEALDKGFKGYAAKRIIIGLLIAVAVIWGLNTGIKFAGRYTGKDIAVKEETAQKPAFETDVHGVDISDESIEEPAGEHVSAEPDAGVPAHTEPVEENEHTDARLPASRPAAAKKEAVISHGESPEPAKIYYIDENKQRLPRERPAYTRPYYNDSRESGYDERQHGISRRESDDYLPKGVAFVNAVIAPLKYELEERFGGWRPNDMFFGRFTDNVDNFQLGVHKVILRTTERLEENISRTGSSAAKDKNLDQARSNFNILPEDYMLPSAESEYESGIKNLEAYKERLIKREARFYTRADNLIPLLSQYELLLGDYDDQLVKQKEEDGNKVSFFKADDYFYQAKGAASAMATILEAVQKDFYEILETRNCTDTLQHAIESCHHATEIEPWIVTNSNLSGIFANHRANMASHISHARFYIEVLIKTLST